jgi:glucosamine-6-phosphate deaminase
MGDRKYYEDYYLIPPEEFQQRQPSMSFHIVETLEDLDEHFARELTDLLKANNGRGAMTKVILPVGPLDYRPLASLCNREGISCRNLVIFMMDEYCTDDGTTIPTDHPLSFQGLMEREFLSLLDEDKSVPPDQIIFPDPQDPALSARKMAELGGVDVCYGGFGINGHVAFNEPPEPAEKLDADAVRNSTTRVLRLSRESVAQMGIGGTGGNLELIPPKAVTLGMKELLSAGEIHLCFMRTWHAGVMRRALFGPVTPTYPASFVQAHPKVAVIMTSYAAAVPLLNVRMSTGE